VSREKHVTEGEAREEKSVTQGHGIQENWGSLTEVYYNCNKFWNSIPGTPLLRGFGQGKCVREAGLVFRIGSSYRRA
jgi:hypothetical protein